MDVEAEIRWFRVCAIGNAIRERTVGYRQKGIRCRGIEDFRESSLRHSGAQPFQSFTLAGIR